MMKKLARYASQTTKILKNTALGALILFMVPAAGHCTPVVNGNFSAGTAGFTFSGNVGVFNSAAYDTCCASGDTGTGNFAAFGGADGPDDGQVSQTIATVAGQEYLLTFQYGAFSSPADRGTQSLLITAGDLDTTLTSGMSERDLSLVLSSYQYEFLASGTSTTLTFADASTSTASIDGFLDTIDVENAPATPEPSALVLLGTGILGMSAFYRNRTWRSHGC
jgi:PEP-CTERM motif